MLRSRGIQEVKGVEIVRSITKRAVQLCKPIGAKEFYSIVSETWTPRKGPVFLEIPLDVQAVRAEKEIISYLNINILCKASDEEIQCVVDRYNSSLKPIVLIGGGIDYSISQKLKNRFQELKVPLMTTYNGADRIDSSIDNYLGRPNTWGQRSSNILIQEADLIIAVGTRLGLQQTGFNWQEFGRKAFIIQVEIDLAELTKGHPRIDLGFCVDADDFIVRFMSANLKIHNNWLNFAKKVRAVIPRIEEVNNTKIGYISPYRFILTLESLTTDKDLIIPCSSGSAFTLTMQLFQQRFGQRVITNKSLASMGYGLSGAIGACIAEDNNRRTILIEGDGGFAQNLQEMGTAEINNLNIKIFIFHDQGHASIRMTQINYFGGKYLGCDKKSGLGLPIWDKLFEAWNIPLVHINIGFENNEFFLKHFNEPGLCVFLVHIDPEQTYFPKISSKITSTGTMVSNPIDKMTPEIDYLNGLTFNFDTSLD